MKKGEKMKYTYYQLGIMAAVVSFLGFVVENIWLAMTKGYINNRNMNAPFLLGYGLLILFMYAVFGTPAAFKMFTKEKVRWKRYLLYFLCSFVVVCIGEIVLGIVVEALCHIEYWNYSNIPMHITKYTSIPTSTAFAAMITILMGNVFPVLMDWICRINAQWAKIICIVLWVVMVVDFFVSFGHMIKAKNFYLKWKIFLKAKK